MDLVFDRVRKVPSSRFERECSLCSSRHGVPIGCSARGCKATYHTTCAIREKLKMQAFFGKDYKGGIKLRSYCKDHCPSIQPENGSTDQADTVGDNDVGEIDMTNLADERVQGINGELNFFLKYVDINDVHKMISELYAAHNRLHLDNEREKDFVKHRKKICPTNPPEPDAKKSDNTSKKFKSRICLTSMTNSNTPKIPQEVDPLVIDLIYRYWILLRTANNGQSLIKFSPTALREKEYEQRKSIMRLRIELERVRNLSYMIGKREKLKSSWLKSHQNIIKSTLGIIDNLNPVGLHMNHSLAEPINDNSNNHRCGTTNYSTSNPDYVQNSQPQGINNKLGPPSNQYLQPTTGMFDESDQLIRDLLICDHIYELPESSSQLKSNLTNLSYLERSTLEGRRTLSLVRRINRQSKNIRHEPTPNPYAKSYHAPKKSDSPVNPATTTANNYHNHPSNKVLKYSRNVVLFDTIEISDIVIARPRREAEVNDH